jgi:1-phosphatidylinositol phosphodiesterase
MSIQLLTEVVPVLINRTDAVLSRVRVIDGDEDVSTPWHCDILSRSGRSTIPMTGGRPLPASSYEIERADGQIVPCMALEHYVVRLGQEAESADGFQPTLLPIHYRDERGRNTFVLFHPGKPGWREQKLRQTDDDAIRGTPAAPVERLNKQQWMKRIPDDRWISPINLPRTHETCARHGISYAVCQNQPIDEQLRQGIRFLDIRCRHFNKAFSIHHGNDYQHLNFNDVLQSCIHFLNTHSSETIVMLVNEEYDAEGNDGESFEYRFQQYIAPHIDRFYLANATPRLGEIRNKIVLIRRFPRENSSNPPLGNQAGIDASGWGGHGSDTFWLQPSPNIRLRIQDDYDAWNGFFDTPETWKWEKVLDVLQESHRNPLAAWYINYTSATKIPFFTPEGIATSPYIPGVILSGGVNVQRQSQLSGFAGTVMLDFADDNDWYLVDQLIYLNGPITGFCTVTGLPEFLESPIVPSRGSFIGRVNTNCGTDGEYIRIVDVRDPSAAPVTSVSVVAFDQAQSGPPTGWQWSPQDLSQGAGGKYCYLIWKTGENNKPPITDIRLEVTDSNQPSADDGWQSGSQDINAGCGGSFIFLHYRSWPASG